MTAKQELFKKYKIEEIEYKSPYFPNGLKDLKDCPQKIFVCGNKELLNKEGIAIVGTRFSSQYGNELSYKFSKELSTDFTIVSGMATGIDQSAHKGALSGKKTIAIIAGGFECAISAYNLKIAKEILDNDGVIITEYDKNIPPQNFTFLNRNRLIAAISLATIVVEAPIKSGAMSTANNAILLNRPLYAVPWNLNYFKGAGCLQLIINGAYPLINSKQIINKFLNKNFKLDLFDNQISIKEISVPEKYMKYYNYIKEVSSATEEQIIANFENVSVSEITSDLLMMELNSYIELKDGFYFLSSK